MFKYFTVMIRYLFSRAVYSLKRFFCREKVKKSLTRQTAPLNPVDIPKYVNRLSKPPVYKAFEFKVKTKEKKKELRHLYCVDISEFKEQILPEGFPATTVWGMAD